MTTEPARRHEAPELEPGGELETQDYVVTRADLVRYAGASGDFNPIHWSDRVATGVGLPGVIAHGMYTLGLASRAVLAWVGDAERIQELGGRFTKPVVVPDDDDGVVVRIAGRIEDVTDGAATIELTVTCGDERVLGMTRARVLC